MSENALTSALQLLQQVLEQHGAWALLDQCSKTDQTMQSLALITEILWGCKHDYAIGVLCEALGMRNADAAVSHSDFNLSHIQSALLSAGLTAYHTDLICSLLEDSKSTNTQAPKPVEVTPDDRQAERRAVTLQQSPALPLSTPVQLDLLPPPTEFQSGLARIFFLADRSASRARHWVGIFMLRKAHEIALAAPRDPGLSQQKPVARKGISLLRPLRDSKGVHGGGLGMFYLFRAKREAQRACKKGRMSQR